MTKEQIKPPFDAIWAVAEYLDNKELRHYCKCIMKGEGDDHIYRHVLKLLRWLSECPDAAADNASARDWLADADRQIAEARAEAKEIKKPRFERPAWAR